jgi:hypothetical protein
MFGPTEDDIRFLKWALAVAAALLMLGGFALGRLL